MKGKERVGWVAGRERARPRSQTLGVWKESNSGGVEGHHRHLVEEEGSFCLGGKVHRRNSWVEQALHREHLLRRAQKAWAYGTSNYLPFCLRKLVRS